MFLSSNAVEPAALSPQPAVVSPMFLCDRLIALAKDAETAGYAITAEQLVHLAITIFDEAPRKPD